LKTLLLINRKNHRKFAVFFIFYTVAAAIISVCNVLMTWVTGDMSQAAVNLEIAVLLRFIIVLTIIMGVNAITSAASVYLSGRYAGRTGYIFRHNFAAHFLGLRYDEFEKQNSGAMLSVLANDIPAAVDYVTVHGPKMIAEIVSVIASVVFMLTINPLYTLIFYAMFPVLVIMQAAISGPINKLAIERSEKTAEFNAVVNDSLQNTATIIAYSLEEYMESRYLHAYDSYFAVLRKYISTMLRLVIAGIVAAIAPILVITVLAAVSVIDKNMTLAEFIAFTGIASTASNWLTMLSQRLRDLKTSAAGAVRLNENTDGTMEDLTPGDQLDAANETAVRFTNVSFSYGEDERVSALSDVSFDIKNGERIAIIGGSGSGKSTILKLMLGLYAPQTGEISVSGQALDTVPLNSLRAHFAYVPQDSYMLPESIGVNIAGAKARSNLEKLNKACRDAGILDFIESLPDEYNTILSEAAENVSGGQRQRLAIARAYFRDSPIVLFDEATSALDPATENSILETLKDLTRNKTLISVAHRRAVISACDRIIVMDGGKVAGTGSHEDLLRSNPVYASLYYSLDETRQIAGVEVQV